MVCAPKILPIGIFLSHTLRSFLGPRFTCLTLSTQRSVIIIIAPEIIFENEVNDSLFSFISHTVADKKLELNCTNQELRSPANGILQKK